ncbi:DUF84 family protein [Halobaculum sp. MBLA0147]|uniref:DUF84 family protein n=1 Tax=Halobaculum sp. MBLA0147 TaxID=3079934 RepID=UPI0035260F34
MHVGVGSGNPVKRAATERALTSDHDAFGVEATVETEPVPSGVSEQPRGHEETRRGAVTRAAAVLAAGEYDLGVGIEGGVVDADEAVAPVADAVTAAAEAGETGGVAAAGGDSGDAAPPGGDDLRLVMWAAVTDGERTEVAAGPSLPLPPVVATRVRDGEELGPVMDDELDETGVARDRGAAGVVTGGRVDREAALAAAVAGALGPFAATEVW